MALRRSSEPPPLTETERLCLAQSAAIDQAIAVADQAMRTNAANRPLVDLALDVQNTLNRARR